LHQSSLRFGYGDVPIVQGALAKTKGIMKFASIHDWRTSFTAQNPLKRKADTSSRRFW